MGNFHCDPILTEINGIPSVSKNLVTLTYFLRLSSKQTTNRCFGNSPELRLQKAETDSSCRGESFPTRILSGAHNKVEGIYGKQDRRLQVCIKPGPYFCTLTPQTRGRNRKQQVLKSMPYLWANLPAQREISMSLQYQPQKSLTCLSDRTS